MNLNYYIRRTINDKLKLGIIIFLFLLPVYDIVMNLGEISRGGSVYEPNIMSFLAATVFNTAQTLMLWYLPIYLLILVGDDCIQDYKVGYKNILISKWGVKKYFRKNILRAFVISFSVILFTLALHLLMAQIVYHGATYLMWDEDMIKAIPSLKSALAHPFLTNLLYIGVASVISGVVGAGAAAVSILLHNRFLVYPVVFFMWYLPFALRNSIMYAFQPFTEYSMQSALPTVFLTVGINLAAVLIAYIFETHDNLSNITLFEKRGKTHGKA